MRNACHFKQIVAQNVIDMSQDGDTVAVVDFDDSTKLLQPLTTLSGSTRWALGCRLCLKSMDSIFTAALEHI